MKIYKIVFKPNYGTEIQIEGTSISWTQDRAYLTIDVKGIPVAVFPTEAIIAAYEVLSKK